MTKVRAPVPGAPYHRTVLIEILGIDCDETSALEASVARALADLGLEGDATVRRVADPAAIVARGARRWPALSVGGKVVCRGAVPPDAEVRAWLEAAET